MDKDAMLGKIFVKIFGLPHNFLGSLWDLLEKLGGGSGQRWLNELRLFLRQKPTWVSRLLKYDRTVELPAIEEFRIDDYIESGEIDGVRVVFGDNFKKVFGGKVENNIPAETLRVVKLTEVSRNDLIIAELGGKELTSVKLAQVFALMRQQGSQRKSVWFVFYVEDDKDVFWAVYCDWHADCGCWRVGASSASFPDEWNAGRFFVSRDSGSWDS